MEPKTYADKGLVYEEYLFENLRDWSIQTGVTICSPAPTYVKYSYGTVMSKLILIFLLFIWKGFKHATRQEKIFIIGCLLASLSKS